MKTFRVWLATEKGELTMNIERENQEQAVEWANNQIGQSVLNEDTIDSVNEVVESD